MRCGPRFRQNAGATFPKLRRLRQGQRSRAAAGDASRRANASGRSCATGKRSLPVWATRRDRTCRATFPVCATLRFGPRSLATSTRRSALADCACQCHTCRITLPRVARLRRATLGLEGGTPLGYDAGATPAVLLEVITHPTAGSPRTRLSVRREKMRYPGAAPFRKRPVRSIPRSTRRQTPHAIRAAKSVADLARRARRR